MKLKIKKFEELTLKELYEILRARVNVFVVEQNCPYSEVDGIDYESLHIFYENEKEEILAYTRTFKKADEENTLQVGRVLTTSRNKGLGLKILEKTIEESKKIDWAKEIYIEAQFYAVEFYKKVGFVVSSNEFLEDNITHVEMRLEI